MTDSQHRPHPRPRRRPLVAALSVACVAAVPAVVAVLPANAEESAGGPPAFRRVDVDSTVSGASFTSVGQVYAGEQDIVTSGYGALDGGGRPVGGGTLQIYRPGASLDTWTKVTVFDADAGIVFPNATTIDDVDGDGDNDIIVPSGYFFGTDPAAPAWLGSTGAITWWENRGPGVPFAEHTIVSGRAASYHGVQYVDLDGDGVRDILSVAEEGRIAGELTDDAVETHFFKGNEDLTFDDPVVLATDLGGSQPVVHDVDGDDDLDIITSQYFRTFNSTTGSTFLWLENQDDDGVLTESDFTLHTIATLADSPAGRGVGMGFQIRPVPDFRGPGTLSWIGTNHVNRCTFGSILPVPEQVIEFDPGTDPTGTWGLTTLSDPATPGPACPSPYHATYQTFSDQITARYGYGQGAPGVFGYGDIDGDRDVDLLVSGDGDRRLWWVENDEGDTTLHRLTGPDEHFGQAGGAVVVDLNGNGTNELVFSSFDQSTLAIWTRDPAPTPMPTHTAPPTTPPASSTPPSPVPTAPGPTVRTVASSLRVTPGRRVVPAGTRATWKVRLTAAPGGPRRTVTVVFDPARGRTVKIGKLRLGPTAKKGVQQARLSFRAKKRGRLVVTYAGTTVTSTLRDTRARGTARVTVR